jgi:site-specific DNA-methyltransferase (adenine-specific)
MWVYGSGFPKSLDVSKAIDKAAGAEREVVGHGKGRTGPAAQPNGGSVHSDDNYQWPGEFSITAPATDAARQWEGWGTALKPAWEPIIVARKPLEGTVAANVQKWGTGAVNVDGCRVELSDGDDPRLGGKGDWSSDKMAKNVYEGGYAGSRVGSSPLGRFPANLIHDGSDEVTGLFPNTNPSCKSPSSAKPESKFRPGQGNYQPQGRIYPDDNGTSAARFFYCAKASKPDRGDGNTHPTVKPHALMRYLCRLVTPTRGVVLDPFTGSGSTGKAAIVEGFRFSGIELDEESCKTAQSRIDAVTPSQPALFG